MAGLKQPNLLQPTSAPLTGTDDCNQTRANHPPQLLSWVLFGEMHFSEVNILLH